MYRKSSYLTLVIISCILLCFLRGGWILAIILAVWYIYECLKDCQIDQQTAQQKRKHEILLSKQYSIGRPEQLILIGRKDLATKYLKKYESIIDELIIYGYLTLTPEIIECLPESKKKE